MENRKSLNPLIFISVFVLMIGIAPGAFAYEAETHAYLTAQAIDIYDQYNLNNPIKEDLRPYLLDGSRREDDAPRYMNHFYDPVYNRGLDDPEWGGGFSSKEWAQSDSKQTASIYKPIQFVASILDTSKQEKIKDMDVNFTWQQAIRYYRAGEIEKAMFALGRVIHLVEDAGVPDHTRNDGHPDPLGDGSPYEKFTSKFTVNTPDSGLISRLANIKPFDSMPTISNYFDELARYSNNNFYSKDTIEKLYDLPKPDFFKKEGKYSIALKKDEYGIEYRLYVKKVPEFGSDSGTAPSLIISEVGGDKILADYWSRLSVKSIQVSAGVIKLFFDDIARVENGDVRLIKDDRNPISWAIDNTRALAQVLTSLGETITTSVASTASALSAQVTDVASDLISSVVGIVKDNAQIANQNLLSSVPLDENASAIQPGEQENIDPNLATPSVENNDAVAMVADVTNESDRSNETNASNIEEAVAEEMSANLKQNNEQGIDENISGSTQDQLSNKPSQASVGDVQKQNDQLPQAVVQVCSFQTSKLPTHQKLLINEVAWMGSSKSANDEWIELKNISSSELNISNWQILDKEEQIKVALPENTKISAGGFLLLERTDDNSALNVKADIIYTGAISNSNEALRLFDDKCDLVDEVFANSEWPAGETGAKRTMERQADLTWWTYNGAGEGSGDALILGTPKKENTIKVIYYGGGGGESLPAAPVVQQPTTNNQKSAVIKILISEIQISPVGNRFIELYNPNDSAVDLTNWYLQRKTQAGASFSSLVSKTYFEGKSIAARGYFLISREALPAADIVLDSLTLTESNSIQFKNSNGDVIDKAGWGGASDCEGVCTSAMIDDQSIQRKIQNNEFIDTDNNADDFEIQNCPSPKSRSGICQASENSNQAPSAFFDLSISQPKINEEIIFNAASSTDPDGNIISYEWNFGDGSMASSTQATTTHSYILSGAYKADLTVYDNKNATSTTFKNITVIESVNKPTKVSNFLAQYDKANKKIDLSWSESADHSGATSTLIYKITDISAVPLLGILTIASSTMATTSVSELGRDYVFSIEAIDEGGLSSDISTAAVSVPGVSIEDVNYLLLNQDQILSSAEGDFGQVFKPLAEGVLGSVKLNVASIIDRGGIQGAVKVDVELYEWVGKSATTSPNVGKGQLLAKSTAKEFGLYGLANYVWDFDNENQVVLDPSKYYYLQVNTVYTQGNLSLFWGLSSPNSGPKALYVIVRAIENGAVIISDPINGYVYQNTDANFTAKYSEPFKNKYGSLVVEVKDFYTEELVSSQTIALSDDQKTVGWHEISGNLNIDRPGYFKLGISLSDSVRSEINFSVFGAAPAEGKLLSQTAFTNSLSAADAAQTFRPMISGQLDSITLKLATGGSGWNYTSLKVYEWTGGRRNSSEGTKGQLLATSESKMFWSNTAAGEPGDFTWQFNDGNEINLSRDNYYYFEAVIDSGSNGGSPSFSFKGSGNDSLVDGGLYVRNSAIKDLYLIINKKAPLE